MAVDYSIIICTYNPDERLLTRCLKAVSSLDRTGIEIEVLLVDNNSDIPINTFSYIDSFLCDAFPVKLLVEKQQGLTHARIAGITSSKGRNVVFFDDDNEPSYDYLQELKTLEESYPNIAAWGPGKIEVDFIDGIDASIEDYAKTAFQKRDEKFIAYASIRKWQDCYPFGTGLSVKANLLNVYRKQVENGCFSMADRTGTAMSSGGDTQIVLFCIEQGYGAGVSPGLKLHHIIPGKRANYHYIKRLVYGACVGGSICNAEVFSEYRGVLSKEFVPAGKFSRKVLKRYVKLSLTRNPNGMLDLVRYISSTIGVYVAMGKDIPVLVKYIIKKMKLV